MTSGVRITGEELVWNEAEFKRFVHGPTGPVVRDLIRRGMKVEEAAKRNASGRPGPEVVTGRLRNSIQWVLHADALGPYVDVGTNVHYAPFLEFGTVNMPAYPFLGPAAEAARLE